MKLLPGGNWVLRYSLMGDRKYLSWSYELDFVTVQGQLESVVSANGYSDGGIRDVVFSPDGKLVFTCGFDTSLSCFKMRYNAWNCHLLLLLLIALLQLSQSRNNFRVTIDHRPYQCLKILLERQASVLVKFWKCTEIWCDYQSVVDCLSFAIYSLWGEDQCGT